MPKPNVLMLCGCVAQGYAVTALGNVPACVVHDCIELALTLGSPLLEGRRAECHCKTQLPSSLDLAFFVYRGPGSPVSLGCASCSLVPGSPQHQDGKCMHVKKGLRWSENVADWEPNGKSYVARGPMLTDAFYCGCDGWD